MIENKIIAWYEKHKRDFPWRHTKNPYYIWVCEVMSQQTQMSRVVDYYQRFLKIFPTIETLATANEFDLLKAWEGLGYYSRVRNMKIAAQQVLTEFAGVFPQNYQDLLKLKGVGTYTAAAIAAIAFDEPVAAVDGNVLRVYTRMIELADDILAQKTKNTIKQRLEQEMTNKNPSSFNQGLIELGATICLPQNPLCLKCPLQAECQAYKNKTTNRFPVKKAKVKQVEERYYTFIVQNQQRAVFLQKQQEKQLLHGLFALPQYENEDNFSEVLTSLQKDINLPIHAEAVTYKGQYKHIFSHKIWIMDVYIVPVTQSNMHFHDSELVPLANAHRKVLA